MAYRVARRLVGGYYGVFAGVLAALSLFSSFKFVRDAALGNSEALLAALVLWAFERHLDGRRDHALYLGVAAALLRPEVWPFLGLYGLWLWLREPQLRLRMVGFAGLIPVLWFGPEFWGSGEPFRASTRANNPNPGQRRLRRAPGPRAGEPLPQGRDRAGQGRHRHRRRLRARDVVPPPPRGRHAGAGGRRLRLVRARRGHDRGRLRGQPALPDRLHRGAHACSAASARRGCSRPLARWSSGSPAAGGRARSRPRRFCAIAFAISFPFIVEKANNTERVSGGLDHEAELWDDLQVMIERTGARAAARLRRRLQRPVPDPDGRLGARHPRHPGGLARDHAARRGCSARARCRTARSW